MTIYCCPGTPEWDIRAKSEAAINVCMRVCACVVYARVCMCGVCARVCEQRQVA